MPDGHVLEFAGVTKRFGPVTAVDHFSARVDPGVVTGFLGPNGAGKTTSLRILLGLITATEGTATIGGRRYSQLRQPLQTVGAALEASSFHPGRSAANHLAVYARAAGLPLSRVDEALGTVGLADVAGRKVGGFSLGMRQRLGLAYTLLGDPGVLVLDEPSNGLDPEGIKWMRGFLRELARQGRTVLVSSHLLTEIQQTAEALLIIARGRLVFQGALADLTAQDEQVAIVDAPDRAALAAALTDAGLSFDVLRSGLSVRGADTAAIGAIAAGAGVALSTLQRRGPALEEVFLALVDGAQQNPVPDAPREDPAPEDPVPAAVPTPEEPETAEPAPAPVIPPAEQATATPEPEPDPEPDPDPAPSDPPGPGQTWDADHTPTDADAEADRFFSRYDAADAASGGEPDPGPAPATDAEADDTQGGEQR